MACRHCVPVGLDCDTMLSARVAPVRRHLPAAGVGIVLGADGAEEHLERRHAERSGTARDRDSTG